MFVTQWHSGTVLADVSMSYSYDGALRMLARVQTWVHVPPDLDL